MIKKYINVFISSLLAGIMIVIGATIYLMIKEINVIVGSLFFALGLFTIIHYKLHLYTGKVGFLLDNKKSYLLELLVCLLGNMVGVILLSSMIKLSRIGTSLETICIPMVNLKQNDNLLSIFIMSFMCGIMIYLAVIGHRDSEYPLGKVLFCFLSVSVFILCSFDHCIANAVYYTYAGEFGLKVILYFIVMIIGNGIGSITFDYLLKLYNKTKY